MFIKNLNFLSLKSKAGQATVEYLLLAVVVLVIARLILTPLGQGLAQYSQSIMGPYENSSAGYYGCLMENGFLPGFEQLTEQGSSGVSINCAIPKAQAISHLSISTDTINGGVSNVTGNSSNNGSDSNNSSSDKDKSSADKNASNRVGGKGGSSSGGSNTSSENSSIGDTGAGSSSLTRVSKKKKKRKKKKARKSISLGGDDNEFSKPKQSKKAKTKVSFQRGEGVLGETYDFEEEEKKPRAPVFASKKSDKKFEGSDAERKTAALKAGGGPSSDSTQNDDGGIDFSRFLKFFIIAGIIVAILIVLFSQVMEFQSRD